MSTSKEEFSPNHFPLENRAIWTREEIDDLLAKHIVSLEVAQEMLYLTCELSVTSWTGCYEYDDDRWYKEFGEAINEIHEALDEIRKVAQSFHASTCKNGTTQTIAEARIDIKKKLAIAELALHIAAESSSQRIARGCGGMIDPPTTEEWVKILKEKAAEQLEKNSS